MAISFCDFRRSETQIEKVPPSPYLEVILNRSHNQFGDFNPSITVGIVQEVLIFCYVYPQSYCFYLEQYSVHKLV